MRKRILTWLLCVAALMALWPAGVFAADSDFVIEDGVLMMYQGSDGDVVIPVSVTSIGDYAFFDCDSLTSVTIGNSVTSIGGMAFYDCDSLTSVTIPDSVTSIGFEAFENCDSLTSVTIPDSVESIGEQAFGYSYDEESDESKAVEGFTIYGYSGSAAEVYADENGFTFVQTNDFVIEDGVLTRYRGSDGDVVIPVSVTSIGDMAFYDCDSLISVTIPDSVTSIGCYAFENCSSLTSVTIPDSVTSIGYHAFRGCSSLTSVTIPDSVASIGYYAFSGCSSLTSVTIPDSVTSIGYEAFRGCTSLTSVTIGNSVTSIGDWAFYDCDSLTSVTIPDSVTSIGWYAFYCCPNLTSVTIPDSVESIGEQAFGYSYDEESDEVKAVDGFTIYGYSGSAAEVYANENGFTFIPLEAPAVLTYVTAKPAACIEPGNTEYWTDGEKYFSDAEGKNEITLESTVIPATGHTFGDWVTVKEPTETEEGMETRICSVCNETETRTIPKLEPQTFENPFTDVSETAYYFKPVLWAVENKITSGTSATTFSPGDGCTRGQVVAFLWRAAGKPEPKATENPFTDVAEKAYYYKAVLWAGEMGITSGTSKTKFSPDATCTRAQIVTFLWRYAGKPEPKSSECQFTDVPDGAYYYKAILWAVENGITAGTTKTTFAPDATCTRGQIVTFLYRDLAK